MAYDFIPKSVDEIKNQKSLKSDEYVKVYQYLSSKYGKDDPIALSTSANEMKNVKISRGFQGLFELSDLKKALDLSYVKLSFGEGSRGGRGVKNQGGAFEINLTKDLNAWWAGSETYTSSANQKLIEELAEYYSWHKAKKFEAIQMGELNQKRPLIFQGKDVFIGTPSDPNIGKTVTDITCMVDGKPIYLSLKATSTVTFFNAGVARIFTETDMKKTGTVTNAQGLALLNILGIDPVKFAGVFNTYGSSMQRYSEDITKNIDRPRLIKLLRSGIGYGFHYVHAKKPTEIHHMEMTKQAMEKLADPKKAIIYYGGKASPAKRIDIEVDTPYIALKINIRNKQGGVYPSHIMCDYTFKRYV
jgi:hypothetical protein